MKRENIKEILETFASANGIPITKVTDGYAGFLCKHLAGFYDTIIINVIDELTGQWDKRSMPQPKTLFDLCYDMANGQGTDREKGKQQEIDKNQQRAWMARKFRHKVALTDITDNLKSGKPLADHQKEGIRTVNPYMAAMWEDDWITRVDYTDEKQALNPITASFIGLYMDFLEKILKPLTGRSRGNLKPKQGEMKL